MNTTHKNLSTSARKLSVLAMSVAVLLSATAAQAAVLEVQQSYWGKGKNALCCDAVFDIGYNKKASDKEWKMHGNGNVGRYQVLRPYESGVSQAFTLMHNSTTGDLTLRIGNSETFVTDLPELTAWGTIGLFVEAKKKNEKKNYFESRIDNLMLDFGSRGQYDIVNDPLIGSVAGTVAQLFLGMMPATT